MKVLNYWEVPALEYIKEELSTYMIKRKFSSPKEGVNKLLQLLPSAYEEEVKDYAPVVKAWIVLQISKQSSLTYHKSEDLGEFIYDTNMYKVRRNSDYLGLHYIDNSGLEPILPRGLRSCRHMFAECELPEGFTLGDKFNTSNVETMCSMFANCELPEGFTLGNKFDTSNVTDMSDMFADCTLPESFTLGNKFDTSNAKSLGNMFSHCIIPRGFSLGDKFNTSNVTDIGNMFASCKLPDGFTLGDKFDTSNVEIMNCMFYNCTLPQGFTLGEKFDASNVDEISLMFWGCTLSNERLDGDPKEIIQMLKK